MSEIKVPLSIQIQMKINRVVAQQHRVKIQLEEKQLELQKLIAEQAQAKADEYVEDIEEQKKAMVVSQITVPGKPHGSPLEN